MEGWTRVFREAAELGVLQADFTGGEPLARPDLVVPAGTSPALDGLSVLVQHGSADQMISIERGRDAVPLLRGWNGDVVYREYDMGHEISAPSLRDLDDFLRRRIGSLLVV